MTTSITEIYDCVFALRTLIEHTDLTTLYDNEQIYKVCEKRLGLPNPTYADVNAVIADHQSSITASMRFGGTTNKSLYEMTTNLVPFPRILFVAPSKAPHVELNDT